MPTSIAIVDSTGLHVSQPVTGLATVLREQGFEVTIHSTLDPRVSNANKLEEFRIVSSSIAKGGPIRSTAKRRVLSPILWLETARSIRSADVIIAFNAQAFVPAALSKMLGSRALLVLYAQELYLPTSFRQSFYLSFLKKFSRYVDLCVSLNEYHAAIRREVYGLTCETIIVAETPMEASPSAGDSAECFPSRDGELRVVYQGTIAPYTASGELFGAVRRCSNVHLTVMGHMPGTEVERGTFEAQIREIPNIEYLGWVDVTTMMQRTAIADVGVVFRPHRGNNVALSCLFAPSLKLFEYMACGVPILASDNVTFRFIEEEGMGLCIPAEEPDRIVDALEWFRGHPRERQKMAMTCRRLFAEKYNRRIQLRPVVDALKLRRPSVGGR